MYFSEVGNTEWQSEYVKAISLGLTMGATFPIMIGNANCNVLIDTGGSCNCMSENCSKKVMLQPLSRYFGFQEPLCLDVTSTHWVMQNVLLNKGRSQFSFGFIVCKNLYYLRPGLYAEM